MPRTSDKAILEAALKLFARKGFYTANVEEIAALAGVGKGTVYRHFTDKKGLFEALMDSCLVEFLACIREAVKAEGTAAARLSALSQAHLAYFARRGEFFMLLIKEQGTFGAEFHASLIKKYLVQVEIIEDCIKEGVCSGELRAVDTGSAAFALFAMLNGVVHRRVISGKPYSPEREGDTVLGIFLEGMRKKEEDVRDHGNSVSKTA